MNEPDFIGEGFHKLDENLVSERPPKIKWGKGYKAKTNEQKIQYLEKLACSMNHAAYLIQQERDQLNELCEKKEEQLIKMDESIRQNNYMLQQEVTRMNKQRQEYHKNISTLSQRIRELENGNKC